MTEPDHDGGHDQPLLSEASTDSTPYPAGTGPAQGPPVGYPHPAGHAPPAAGPVSGPFPAAGPYPAAYPNGAYQDARQPRQPYAGYVHPGYGAPPHPPYAGPPQAGPGGVPLPQPQGRPAQHGHADLDSAQFVRRMKRPPQSGWRRWLYLGTGKLVNPGESPADRRRRELASRVNQPLRGCYRIAMLSLKGGVGKTTMTTALGSTFSSLRGDRVIAVDANPDRGTLSQKIPIETSATVRHLLRDAEGITRYSDVRAYTSQGPSRLEVLASESDPAVSEAFSEHDYLRAVNLLERFYNLVFTDCGTGLMHSAMKGVLDSADSLVVVSSGSLDGARSASATLDWLDAHGYGDLVARSVAVINSVRPNAGSVDLEKLAAHFAARVRAVARIPFDPHLEEGAEIDLERLHRETRDALLELAATVADGFAADRLVR
ncbi:MinD/ParA family ATP-binding protein [Saccharomonospora saliphila]|uniref:MinD/ParA family ATP-binding protein n=1 Tax=Saccharomonospora saliphila TaxID=369829 RepID=UPI00048F8DBE|nr:MinD/ParA family protein [Saccharomonospora saliphila]